MKFYITQTLTLIQTTNTDDYDIYNIYHFLCWQGGENKWKNAPEIRAYEYEGGTLYHYIKWRGVEERIKEKTIYAFVRQTGAFIGEFKKGVYNEQRFRDYDIISPDVLPVY